MLCLDLYLRGDWDRQLLFSNSILRTALFPDGSRSKHRLRKSLSVLYRLLHLLHFNLLLEKVLIRVEVGHKLLLLLALLETALAGRIRFRE